MFVNCCTTSNIIRVEHPNFLYWNNSSSIWIVEITRVERTTCLRYYPTYWKIFSRLLFLHLWPPAPSQCFDRDIRWDLQFLVNLNSLSRSWSSNNQFSIISQLRFLCLSRLLSLKSLKKSWYIFISLDILNCYWQSQLKSWLTQTQLKSLI
jgi:hypothetical protein